MATAHKSPPHWVLTSQKGDNLCDKLQKLQNQAAQVITGADYLTPTKEILNKLKERRNKQKTLMMFKIVNRTTMLFKTYFLRKSGSLCIQPQNITG